MAHDLKPILNSIDSAARAIQPLLLTINKAIENIAPQIPNIINKIQRVEKLEKWGWLPHYTMPFEILDFSDQDFSTKMEKYYQDNWTKISEDWLSRINGYSIDTDAKETFKEALENHRNRHYRSVVRVLFPEIERVTRRELDDKSTSQKKLKELAGTLTSHEIEPRGYYSIILYKKLIDHLYANVKTSSEVEAAAKDPVPNRHAAIHGLVRYDTAKNSLNTLIMTDYIFQTVVVVRNR